MLKKNVLIVEDDAIIANFIQLKLEEMGYHVPSKARNAKQAIEMAEQFQPDLILMDVMLEGEMDGIQAVEEITKTLDIPVIYLTASSDENTIGRLMKTEPHGFLIKPFDDRILSSAVHIAVYRHKTKKELFDTKEMLRTTIESIDDMVFSIDNKGMFTHYHSGNKHQLNRFQSENVVGKSIAEVFPAEVAEKIQESFQWVKDFKEPHSVEFKIEEKDNIWWFRTKLTLRKDLNGNVPGITMVMSDITQNKNMHQELRVSQDKLMEAQNIAGLGSCDIFYRENKVVCNDMYFKLLDIDDKIRMNNFTEENLLEIIHPEDRSRYKMLKKRVMEEEMNEFSINFRVLDRKANVRYVHMAGQIRYDKNGEPERMTNTLQDVTWQKNSEKLRQDVELARKTAEMKQRFFARLSHEIRNPVNGITGLLQLLERTRLDEEQKSYTQALQVASDTLLNLLNDVLDYSKIESGMMKIKPCDFSVRKSLKNLQTYFTPIALEKNLEFRYKVPDDIPQNIVADESKILQVLNNLISNALKFTRRGFVEVRLSTQSRVNEELNLLVEVEDSGSGIKSEDQKELFKDFSQLENETSIKVKGSGLGLSICRQLVTLMGGEIGVRSDESKKGTTFWFTLPVLIAADQTHNDEKTTEGKETERKNLNCSVLLVEDMIVNQKVIKLILEAMGCNVAVASNGQQAVEMFRETAINAFNIFGRIHYDIILMDQMMPVLDGLTALQILKKEHEKLPPVIVLTADESFAQNNKYLESGFDDCIIKPVKTDDLYQKIKNLTGQIQTLTNEEKLEVFSLESVEEKPVINNTTLDLIIKNARQNNFDIGLLFESFFEDMEGIYQQSLTAIEMNDHNALRLIVMTVKGLSGNMGASQLHLVAKLMDRYIRNDQFEEATALLPLLTEKYSVFKSTLETQYLKAPAETER